MKRILLLFCIMNLVSFAKGQISIIEKSEIGTTQNKPKEKIETVIPYDSLYPIVMLQDTIIDKRIIGQKLFLPRTNNPIALYTSSFKRIHCETIDFEQNYDGILKEVTLITNVYKPDNKCLKPRYSNETYKIKTSAIDSISNRYYRILDAFGWNSHGSKIVNKSIDIGMELTANHTDNSAIIDIRKCTDVTLKLKDDISGDTVFYNLSQGGGKVIYNGITYSQTYSPTDFISVGYYSKLKQLYEGKNMVWYLGSVHYDSVWENREKISDSENKIIDFINSTEYSKAEVGQNFKCTAIKLYHNENFNTIVAVLKNDNKEITISCPNNLMDREYVRNDLFGIDLFNNDFTSYITPKLHTNLDKFLLEEDVNMIETDKKFVKFKKDLNRNSTYDPKEERLNECIKLYGKKNGTLIANYSIAIGMTRTMCESAGFNFASSMTTKQGKTVIMRSTYERAVLVNGIVTKIYKF